HLVLASRVAGVGAPVDSAFTDLDDTDGLRRNALVARDLGFSGKSVLHPRQVPVVNEVFAPAADEVAAARRVVAAAAEAGRRGVGALRLDGRFVDAAVVARAQALLAMAREDEDAG
ncbi:MAG TPA: HpcH/HpaI aldolase/citrate lyase family protein, partial [Mycobacteriales bacterium]|nr:HpcH/HpaI aldolase/citrate lyase family protein [Mycobacteriales bacterium]